MQVSPVHPWDWISSQVMPAPAQLRRDTAWLSMLALAWICTPAVSTAQLQGPVASSKVWKKKSTGVLGWTRWTRQQHLDDAVSGVTAWLSWEKRPSTTLWIWIQGDWTRGSCKFCSQPLLLPFKYTAERSSHLMRLCFLTWSVDVSDTHAHSHVDKFWNQKASREKRQHGFFFFFLPCIKMQLVQKGRSESTSDEKMFPRNICDSCVLPVNMMKQQKQVVTISGLIYIIPGWIPESFHSVFMKTCILTFSFQISAPCMAVHLKSILCLSCWANPNPFSTVN